MYSWFNPDVFNPDRNCFTELYYEFKKRFRERSLYEYLYIFRYIYIYLTFTYRTTTASFYITIHFLKLLELLQIVLIEENRNSVSVLVEITKLD